MHMSSACPRGKTPGQQGEYVGEYSGGIGFSAPVERAKFTIQITHKHVDKRFKRKSRGSYLVWQLCACLQLTQDKNL